jgi:hypothetical protein
MGMDEQRRTGNFAFRARLSDSQLPLFKSRAELPCLTRISVNNLRCARATGAIAGGPLVMFGDVELGGVNVIQGFSATALMLPTAGLAGILGKRFFDCFDAVSLDWSQRPGTATFHQVPNHPPHPFGGCLMPHCGKTYPMTFALLVPRPPHDRSRRRRSLTTGF